MSFDPSKDPDRYVLWPHANSVDVLGPADRTEGACWGREQICTCIGSNREKNAANIVAFLNDASEAAIAEQRGRQ